MRKRRRSTNEDTETRCTVGYVRCSTEEQSNGVTLAAQEARIRAYCVAMGWQVSEVVRDAGASAKCLKRPGMTKLLADVRAGKVERAVVLKLDRATRSTRDLADMLELFEKGGAALVSVSESLDTSSASGRLVVNMLGVIAQWEREAIAERTATALSHKRSSLRAYAPTPFGYRRVGVELVTDDCEQAALQEAQRMDRDGASFREIARMLTARGVFPKRGRTWHASSVRAMLRSRIATENAA